MSDAVDLLVLGAGMAGCAAAARAAQDGASVVLVEKSSAVGGSAAYAGFIWSAPTVEVAREQNPDADPALSNRLVDDYDDAIDWVRSLGIEVGDPVTVVGFGQSQPGRANDARPLSEPPYYVIEVVPAITFSFGGLLIDPQARVLDEQGEPIPGLLAAGADTGGVFVRAYAGGLANALIFGLQAAATALAR
jgi:succinate dehydrogenase/fumarate reductase flavoprotein subunit